MSFGVDFEFQKTRAIPSVPLSLNLKVEIKAVDQDVNSCVCIFFVLFPCILPQHNGKVTWSYRSDSPYRKSVLPLW